MTDLFVYDFNGNLISQHKVDFEVDPVENLIASKSRCKEFLKKKFNISFVDSDVKITLNRKFDDTNYSILLKISNKQIVRELILTNILKND